MVVGRTLIMQRAIITQQEFLKLSIIVLKQTRNAVVLVSTLKFFCYWQHFHSKFDYVDRYQKAKKNRQSSCSFRFRFVTVFFFHNRSAYSLFSEWSQHRPVNESFGSSRVCGQSSSVCAIRHNYLVWCHLRSNASFN